MLSDKLLGCKLQAYDLGCAKMAWNQDYVSEAMPVKA
jgi:hypothetical protein